MGVHWKIWFLGMGSTKNNILGELPKKGELGQFADFRGGLENKGRGWHLNAHYAGLRTQHNYEAPGDLHNDEIVIMQWLTSG